MLKGFNIQLSLLFYRIVNAAESHRVLKEVENKLRSYPFKFKEATILTGQQEGAYGWITVNYLLENFVRVSSDFSMLNCTLYNTLTNAL